jgi:hypothetical protein
MSEVRRLHEAARTPLRDGADAARLDTENNAIFFGRPEVVAALLEHGSAPNRRNRHGLTPLGCAPGGTRGEGQRFADATLADWQRCADLHRARGAVG